MVQGPDLTLDAPPARQVDHRIARGEEDIAGAENVRASKKHDAVAIGMRFLGEHLYCLAVESETLSIQVCERRPRSRWHSRSVAAQPLQYVVLREKRHFSRQLVDPRGRQQGFVR